jgi:hypothetical protein
VFTYKNFEILFEMLAGLFLATAVFCSFQSYQSNITWPFGDNTTLSLVTYISYTHLLRPFGRDIGNIENIISCNILHL